MPTKPRKSQRLPSMEVRVLESKMVQFQTTFGCPEAGFVCRESGRLVVAANESRLPYRSSLHPNCDGIQTLLIEIMNRVAQFAFSSVLATTLAYAQAPSQPSASAATSSVVSNEDTSIE